MSTSRLPKRAAWFLAAGCGVLAVAALGLVLWLSRSPSAAAPIFRVWAREYQKLNTVALAYEPSGSAAGLQKIRAREVAFGASDIAPPTAELGKDGLVDEILKRGFTGLRDRAGQ